MYAEPPLNATEPSADALPLATLLALYTYCRGTVNTLESTAPLDGNTRTLTLTVTLAAATDDAGNDEPSLTPVGYDALFTTRPKANSTNVNVPFTLTATPVAFTAPDAPLTLNPLPIDVTDEDTSCTPAALVTPAAASSGMYTCKAEASVTPVANVSCALIVNTSPTRTLDTPFTDGGHNTLTPSHATLTLATSAFTNVPFTPDTPTPDEELTSTPLTPVDDASTDALTLVAPVDCDERLTPVELAIALAMLLASTSTPLELDDTPLATPLAPAELTLTPVMLAVETAVLCALAVLLLRAARLLLTLNGPLTATPDEDEDTPDAPATPVELDASAPFTLATTT